MNSALARITALRPNKTWVALAMALAIGLGGAIGELWVQDGLLLLMALGLSGFAGYRLDRYHGHVAAG